MKRLLLLLGLAGAGALAARSPQTQTLTAHRITRTADIPQGKAVLGKVGDYLLANDRIAIVIDDVGKRQGFAESGGNIVDAVRRDRNVDLLAQLVTYFDDTFPRQAIYERVEIVRDGSDGAEARIRVAGHEMKDAAIQVTTEYSVRPGQNYVRVDTTLVNTGRETLKEFELGDAVQWGFTEHFAAGIGYNLGGRTLAELEWLAGPGDGASYGYTVASGTFFGPHGSNWSDANVSRPNLAPNIPVTYSRFLIVGTGDIASVTDEVYALRGEPVGTVTGKIVEEGTGSPVADAVVNVQRADGTPANLIKPRSDGTFRASLPPGDYVLAGSAFGRAAPQPVPVAVRAGAETPCSVSLGRPGRIEFTFKDERGGKPLPVKVTLKGLGDTPDPYFGPGYLAKGAMNVVFTHTGSGQTLIPPGLYALTASRGIEYTLFETRIVIEPGRTTSVLGRLERVVDTTGYIAADFHLHSEYSADSNVPLRDKVIGLVAEGVEFAVSSDHNFIADYRETIAQLGLQREIASCIGNEITVSGTIHFNVFPLQLHPELPNNGAIEPSKMKVQEMIDAVRKDPGEEVVQLNHPRAGNIGYFTAAKFDSAALRSPDPSFTLDFDAIEVFNGKRVTEAQEVLRDWFNLLNAGYRFAATGNSDSHKLVAEEAGYPRNFVAVGKDDPSQVTEDEIVAAVKAHRVVVSNGPFLRVDAGGHGMGETFASGGKPVTFTVRLQSAPWVDVSALTLVENGRVVARKLIPATARVDKGSHTFTASPKTDAWYVVLAYGNRGLDPVIPKLGDREILPLAFTNPFWVDADGDGKFTPPRTDAKDSTPRRQGAKE